MDRIFVALGALSACLAVIAGAFGSHALKRTMSADMLAVFEIAVRYQMYHALALFGVGLAFWKFPEKLMNVAGWCFVAGTVLFSGSLYQLSLTGSKWVGIVTPIGGGIWMIGWLCIAVAALKARR